MVLGRYLVTWNVDSLIMSERRRVVAFKSLTQFDSLLSAGTSGHVILTGIPLKIWR